MKNHRRSLLRKFGTVSFVRQIFLFCGIEEENRISTTRMSVIHRDMSVISIFTISINNERFLGLVFITFCCFMRDDLRI